MKNKLTIPLIIAVIGIITGLIAWELGNDPQTAQTPSSRIQHAEQSQTQPSAEEIQRRARERIEANLVWADKEDQRLLAIHLQNLENFFTSAKKRTPRFADEALGLHSKWSWVVDRLPFTRSDHSETLLRHAFAEHVFTSEQLSRATEQTVCGYADDLAATDNQLLVRVRADLADLPATKTLVAADEKQLRSAYEESLNKSLAQMQGQIRTDLSADVGSLIVCEALASAAVRLGVSGGILGAGGSATWATLGVSLAVGLLVDQLVTWIWDRWADPQETMCRALDGKIDELHHAIVEGDGNRPGLRQHLEKLAHERAMLRRATLLGPLQQKGVGP